MDARVILIAFVAQLGERKTEDLKVRGSIPRGGIFLHDCQRIMDS